jgi:hypothetical protein
MRCNFFTIFIMVARSAGFSIYECFTRYHSQMLHLLRYIASCNLLGVNTTWHYIPYDRILHNHCYENLKSYITRHVMQGALKICHTDCMLWITVLCTGAHWSAVKEWTSIVADGCMGTVRNSVFTQKLRMSMTFHNPPRYTPEKQF